MLRRIKRAIVRWLLEEFEVEKQVTKKTNKVIEIYRNGRIEKVTAVGAVGLHLLCELENKDGQGVVSIDWKDCRDADHFWRLWTELGGGRGLQWENGDECTIDELMDG